ncbi:DM13 domain-containing protein [Runella sp.]|jgi:hypothetical protein|uniref:DM13 domain-containing protein n=1 Tax=Runella sp. TaxID=1960881 RepID=UPI00262AB6D7|nr:DM13 domain-containing protein [Runella sp.]
MKYKWLMIGLIIAISACQKTEELQPVSTVTPSTGTALINKPIDQFDVSGQKLAAQGEFMSNVHTTSGNVKVYEKEGKRTLVFENFKTDGGPDLRIYLSEDKAASKDVEVSNKVNSGNYFIELPAAADHKTQKFVLIWCKQYSVLFGNAELK